jgi:hypothetical protein
MQVIEKIVTKSATFKSVLAAAKKTYSRRKTSIAITIV